MQSVHWKATTDYFFAAQLIIQGFGLKLERRDLYWVGSKKHMYWRAKQEFCHIPKWQFRWALVSRWELAAGMDNRKHVHCGESRWRKAAPNFGGESDCRAMRSQD